MRAVYNLRTYFAENFEKDLLLEIKKNILPSSTVEKVVDIVEGYFEDRSKNHDRDSKHINQKLLTVSQAIKNLLTIAESGIGLEELTTKLKNLERQKSELEFAKQSCDRMEEKKAHDLHTMEKVAEFFNDFEKRFENAPMSERKALVHQVVEKIVIDQETRIAKCYLLKIPRQDLGVLGKNKEGEGITYLWKVSPTRFELVLEA